MSGDVLKGESFKEILCRARQGDREAADRLIHNYGERIMAAIRAQLGGKLRDKFESMDIYQTAMKSAFRNLDQFKGDTPEAFLGWVARILSHDIRDKVDYVTSEKRNREREQPMAWIEGNGSQVEMALPSGEPTPSQHAMADEKQRILDEAVRALPHDLRRIVLLRGSGRTCSEIAEKYGVGVRTVERHYAKALIALRKFMEKRGYGEPGRA